MRGEERKNVILKYDYKYGRKSLTSSGPFDILPMDKRKAPDKQLQLPSRASHASS